MRTFLFFLLAVASLPAAAQAQSFAGSLSSSPQALQRFAGDLPSFTGRWTDGSCRARWNDWSISGLNITFEDQSGGLDVERVVAVERGAFVTQSVEASRGRAGGLWRYQPLNPATLQVQNLSTRTTFLLRRCPAPVGGGMMKDR
jgi:hypothetical protein